MVYKTLCKIVFEKKLVFVQQIMMILKRKDKQEQFCSKSVTDGKYYTFCTVCPSEAKFLTNVGLAIRLLALLDARDF